MWKVLWMVGRQVAEAEPTLDLEHLLDDLDQDRDADRVDDLGLLEVEQQAAVALVDELVGDPGDLLAALIVDVAVGVDHGDAVPRSTVTFMLSVITIHPHRALHITTVVPPAPDSMCTSSIRPSMI